MDNILADAEADGTGAGTGSAQTPSPAPAAAPAKQSPGMFSSTYTSHLFISTDSVLVFAGPSRAASVNRANDRLQERLARAIAAKSAGQRGETAASRSSMSAQGSPRQSMDAPSRASMESLDRPSPAPQDQPREALSPRSSQDVARKPQNVVEEPAVVSTAQDGEKVEDQATAETTDGARTSEETAPTVSVATKSEALPQAKPGDAPETAGQLPSNDTAGEVQAGETEKRLDDATLQHQEEIHGYVERIDALEAKLQYLARETTDAARKAALAAPAGGAEKKLAEKDQQIAQLMEEGKNLASTEQKHRTIMKKLRAKITEDEKELTAIKAAKEKSDKEVENLRRRAKRADELEKARDDLQKRFEQVQRELHTLRPELRSKDNIIAELRSQLQKANEQVDAAAAKANGQAREQDRRRIAELEESVAALQVEKNLVADRAKLQASDLREKAERADEKARALELELKAEVQVMESKLEAMRIRAEEASTGAIGDSQAKLLRQVETLQTQYSIASENWQGIEATLLARIANLERERDEALQRESEMRKKAREAVRTPPPFFYILCHFQVNDRAPVGCSRKAPRGRTRGGKDEAPQHPGGREVVPVPA